MKFSVCAVDRDLPVNIPFPLRGSSYAECADVAAKLGFDGIELQIQDPKFYNGKEIKRMLDDHGLSASAVTTGLAYTYEGMSMTHPDPAVRAATVDRLKAQLDFAKEIDSQILVGFIRGRQLDRSAREFEDILTDSVGKVLEYAEQLQTPFIMEQVNHIDGDLYCSTERTMQFLEKFNSPWLVYNGDTYHMHLDDVDAVEALKRSFSKLVLFHVSDVGRLLPDDKHFNFYEVAKVLKEVNYDKWTSIECKPLPTSYEACKTGIEYLKRVFG